MGAPFVSPMTPESTLPSAHSLPPGVERNPRLFILFRILFNCRFYYPVYAIMFLDFGLSEEQFAYLNVAWAVAIVLLEVPSGALADQFGRRTLVVAAAILMVVEMGVLCAMPVVDPGAFAGDPEGLRRAIAIVFAVFCLNRVISGAAEAAASGADEALAYDSLPEKDRDLRWSRLTAGLMKWQSIGFIAVTVIGASAYDPEAVNRLMRFVGCPFLFTQQVTLKFPIYLTFGMAIATLFVALRMKEPPELLPKCEVSLLPAVRRSFRRTFAAGGWILNTPAALMLILIGLFYDSIIRLFYTVGSIWLEVIGFEPRYFGLISVAGSLTGILAAVLGARMMARYAPGTNFRILTLLVLIGLLSLAFPVRYWSVVFLPALWLSMRLVHFFLSNYLNRVTDSEHRATVLSFRGLTMNLSYGMVTWMFGWQMAFFRKRIEAGGPAGAGGGTADHRIFEQVVQWWWIYFAVVVAGLWLFRRLRFRQTIDRMLEAGAKKM